MQKMLPKDVTDALPHCVYMFKKDKDGNDVLTEAGGKVADGLNYEVLSIIAWIIARREKPEITQNEVAERIGMNNYDNIDKIIREIWYFTTTQTREDFNASTPAEGEGEEEAENPTPDQDTNQSE